MNEKAKKAIYKALKATSYVLVIKGAVFGSLATLALFGVTVPLVGPALGIDATDFTGGVAASVGAIAGAFAAIRA